MILMFNIRKEFIHLITQVAEGPWSSFKAMTGEDHVSCLPWR